MNRKPGSLFRLLGPVVLFSVLPVFSTSEGIAAWSVEVVQPDSSQIGSRTAIAHDNLGNPSIVYGDGALGEIRYAAKSGGSWNFETIDSRDLVVPDHSHDSTGRPAVSYTTSGNNGFDIFYAEKVSGSWVDTRIERRVSSGVNSLAFDANDNPSVAFDKQEQLKFAIRSGSTWIIETVASGIDVGEASLAFDGSGNPSIAYVETSTGPYNVVLATRSGGVWSFEIIDSNSENTRTPSLAFDPINGEAVVSYYLSIGCETRVARRTAGSWQVETAVSGWSKKLRLDSSGVPFLAHVNCVNDQVLVSSGSAAGWSSELVTSSGFSGAFTTPSISLAFDDPEISFTRRANASAPRDLRFASNAAGCSTNVECDDGNDCTTDTCDTGSCTNSAVPDESSCNAGAGVCCGGGCTSPCLTSTDCDDGDVCTDDFCFGTPGTCSAFCDNIFDVTNDPACDVCVPTSSKEKGPKCSDGIDNDCDGLIDGDDPDC